MTTRNFDDFIAFCRERGDDTFNYWDTTKKPGCAVTQYGKSRGIDNAVIELNIRLPNGDITDGDFMVAYACGKDETISFNELANRLMFGHG